MAVRQTDTSLETILLALGKGANVDFKSLVNKAKKEYDLFRSRLRPADKKKISYLETLIESIETGRKIADGVLQAAQGEFNKYFSEHKQYVIGEMRKMYSSDSTHQTSLYPAGSDRHGVSGQGRIHLANTDLWGPEDHTFDNEVYRHHGDSVRKPTPRPDHEEQSNRQRKAEKERDQDRKKQMEVHDLAHQSKSMSMRVKANNPQIADLSDQNRPTKIAERFTELYDNIWTDAFEDIINTSAPSETEAIKKLLQIVVNAYIYCDDVARKQIIEMENAVDHVVSKWLPDVHKQRHSGGNRDVSFFAQYRKDLAGQMLDSIKKGYMKQRPKVGLKATPNIERYTDECVEVSWWMCVQDPPIHMEWGVIKSDPFKLDIFRPYTKTGSSVDFIVWPALRLMKDGPVLAKGVAQGK